MPFTPSTLSTRQEDDAATAVNTPSASYAAVFDPLDGSRNIEVSIPTGAIFGFYGLQVGGGSYCFGTVCTDCNN